MATKKTTEEKKMMRTATPRSTATKTNSKKVENNIRTANGGNLKKVSVGKDKNGAYVKEGKLISPNAVLYKTRNIGELSRGQGTVNKPGVESRKAEYNRNKPINRKKLEPIKEYTGKKADKSKLVPIKDYKPKTADKSKLVPIKDKVDKNKLVPIKEYTGKSGQGTVKKTAKKR